MKQDFIYSKLFKNIYLGVIITILFFAFIIPLTNQSFQNEMCYFTNQSNFLIFIFSIFLVFANLFVNDNKNNFMKTTSFTILWLCLTHIILVTMVIFCFFLLPMGVIFNAESFKMHMDFYSIITHVIAPLLFISYFYIYSKKQLLEFNDAFFCLIYPSIYFCLVNLRVFLNVENLIGENSPYPHFFFDPNFNNQGYLPIVFYIIILMLLFYFLGFFLIKNYIKISKKELNI